MVIPFWKSGNPIVRGIALVVKNEESGWGGVEHSVAGVKFWTAPALCKFMFYSAHNRWKSKCHSCNVNIKCHILAIRLTKAGIYWKVLMPRQASEI